MALLKADTRKSPLVGEPSVIKKHFPATTEFPIVESLSNAFLYEIEAGTRHEDYSHLNYFWYSVTLELAYKL